MSDEEAAATAAHLLGDDLFSGWGIRTLGRREGGYNPLGYHTGTVWPHENSMIAAGLARYGHHAAAATIGTAILSAAPHFEHRLPEVFAGYPAGVTGVPVAFPTASRPHAAHKGSRRQTQRYVNEDTAMLNEAIAARFPELAGVAIEWRSPLPSAGYAEYWDTGFLEAVDQAEHADALKRFWPTGGPHWDALAVTRTAGGRQGVVLVEGKSYVKELYGGGCFAKPGSVSRRLIEDSLAWTRDLLGVTTRTSEDWCGPLYQSANRLAFLCWLRALGVDAWLVHVLFSGDPIGPTSAEQWEAAMSAADVALGTDGLELAGAGHIVLPAV